MIRLRLSPDKRNEEARKSLDRKTEFARRAGFEDLCARYARWDRQWRRMIPRQNKPWPHATDYNTPLTFSKVEDVHAVLFGYVSDLSFFSVAASAKRGLADEVMRKRAQDWDDLLKWSLTNESNAIAFLDRFVHDGCQYGSGFGMVNWLREIRRIRSELFVPDELREDKDAPDRKVIKAALGENLLKGPTPRDDGYTLRFRDDDGEEKDGRCWVDRDYPFRPPGEPVVILERDVTTYDAPKPRNVSPWNMFVPPDVRDLQSARRYWYRDFLSYNDIARLAQLGVFNALSRDDLRDLRTSSSRLSPNVSSSRSAQDMLDETRDFETGVTAMESRTDLWETFFEYAFEDVDDDGYDESIVRAVIVDTKPRLAMRHRMEYLKPDGRRPHFDWHYVPVDGRYYGMGVPEILEQDQLEGNAFYQARSDVLEIITKPGGMYDPMSGLAPDEIRYTPGMMVKVRDPDTAYRPFVFPVDPTLLLREQSGIDMQAERVIGSTDMGLGRGPTQPNAPRTLGGTAIIVRQQQVRMDVPLRRLIYGSTEAPGGVSEFLHQYMGLMQAFLPEAKEFRALGTNELRVVQRVDLQGRFDFEMNFGPEVNNPQLRMQNAAVRYQAGAANPMVMQNPYAFWYLTKDFFEASGMKNAGRILPAPSGQEAHPPMTQEEEFTVLAKGIYVDALAADNHAEHLTRIAELIQNPARLAEHFGPNELPMLERHATRHLEFQMAGASQALGAPGTEGLVQTRGPRSTLAQAGVPPVQETMAGPIETDIEQGMVM